VSSNTPREHPTVWWVRRLPQSVANNPRLVPWLRALRSGPADLATSIRQSARASWESPRVRSWRGLVAPWRADPVAGAAVLLVGTALVTLLVLGIDRVVSLPNPGVVYLPLVAMLAYHWGWRLALIAGILEILCVYYFFIPPTDALKPLSSDGLAQLVTLAAVTAFVLGLVQLARSRRTIAEREAGRFAALNRIGAALASELHESPLLHLIARTARDLTEAEFAAFTLRPVNELGEPLVPSEGYLFHLAAVIGVTSEQEALFRRTPLGGEGLLAPIFRHGIPVRVPDVLAHMARPDHAHTADPRDDAPGGAHESPKDAARRAALDYAHGNLSIEELRAVGVPRGHPIVRSFLGAPLLDTEGQVRGGLLLGHSQPDRFTHEDEVLLVALAAQAAVALENARLYRAAQMQAQELDATFESIADGITLLDQQGKALRENAAARRLREGLERMDAAPDVAALLRAAAARASHGATDEVVSVDVPDEQGETHAYVVSAAPLQPVRAESSPDDPRGGAARAEEATPAGAVVVWHDVTEAHRLLAEQRARTEAEARRALLQTVVDALPSGVYLVRGQDARLVLANRAAADVWGAQWPEGQPMQDFLQANGVLVVGAEGRPLPLADLATLRTVRTEEAVRHHQEVIRHPDGSALPILLNAVALDPQVLGWPALGSGEDADRAALVVLQDVTALKEAEQLKDEFIGIAAHELRTPMAALQGFAQMLTLQTARGKGPALDEWQREAVEAIDQATSRLVELTDDLLDVTRLQGGRLELRIEPTDLVALASRVAKRAQITSERHPITIHATSEHIVVPVDVRRMEQVLSNLINNAVKYSPDGGVVAITIRDHPDTCLAELSVRDQGIGIPDHQHSRIFGRFARADNARDLGISGTGLGLYLCRELVERHGGRIWFESAEGQGSIFSLTLPLYEDPYQDSTPSNGAVALHASQSEDR
jgi:signal transduction histidine kinase/GAF domain-containing protein